MKKFLFSLFIILWSVSAMGQTQIDTVKVEYETTLHLANCTFHRSARGPFVSAETIQLRDPDIRIRVTPQEKEIEFICDNNNERGKTYCTEPLSYMYFWSESILCIFHYEECIEYRIIRNGTIVTRIRDYGSDSRVDIFRQIMT